MLDLSQIEIRRICAECSYGKFNSGHRDIDGWLKKKALKRCDRLDSGVQVATPMGDNQILGYYALKICSEPTKLLTGVHKSSLQREQHYPAIEIEWMGVDKKFQKQGLGTRLLVHALQSSVRAFEYAGGYGVVLTPEVGTEGFYEQYGFDTYGDELSKRMVLPSASIVDLFAG